MNRQAKRIPIVLNLINWIEFIKDNITEELSELDFKELIEHITLNTESISNCWEHHPDWRLGQLLINQGYIKDDVKLCTIEEDQWLIDNGYCNIEDIKFWSRTRDKYDNLLPSTEFILLKDLDDANISAILDWFDEHNKTLNEDYKEYFEKRINKIKNKV